MAPPRQVLVVNRNPQLQLLLDRSPVKARVVATVVDAVNELRQDSYDAVLLLVDQPRELSLIPRMKEVAPKSPLIALLPEPDGGLTVLARESGADDVRFTGQEPSSRFSRIERLLETTDDLIRRSRAVCEASQALTRRLSDALAQNRQLREHTLELARDIAKVSWSKVNPLVVEDDRDQVLLLKKCFQRIGITPRLPSLGNGQEAIEYLAGLHRYVDRGTYPLPNLVVLDLHLPRKSGLEVLAWIRSQPSLANLTVFLLTSSSLDEDKDRALSLGADYYYEKPIGLEGLRFTIERMAVRWALIHRARRGRR